MAYVRVIFALGKLNLFLKYLIIFAHHMYNSFNSTTVFDLKWLSSPTSALLSNMLALFGHLATPCPAIRKFELPTLHISKRIPGLADLSYHEHLTLLGLNIPELTQIRAVFVYIYKILYGLVELPVYIVYRSYTT